MSTVLVPAGPHAVGDRIELDEDEAHHLRVRRLAPGAELAFLDGAGASGRGLLEGSAKHPVLMVTSVECHARPAPITLAVGAGDRDRFALVVEKAAELGVTQVIPLETERTASVATRVRESHVEKLARRGREAIKQSGSFWAPVVTLPRPFAQFVADPPAGARWVLDPDGETAPALTLTESVVALVGPEGGLTHDELDAALAAGFRSVRAGPHVLRFETAAVAAMILVQAARIAIGRQDG